MSIQGSVTTHLMVAIKTPKTKLFCKDFFFFKFGIKRKQEKSEKKKKKKKKKKKTTTTTTTLSVVPLPLNQNKAKTQIPGFTSESKRVFGMTKISGYT